MAVYQARRGTLLQAASEAGFASTGLALKMLPAVITCSANSASQGSLHPGWSPCAPSASRVSMPMRSIRPYATGRPTDSTREQAGEDAVGVGSFAKRLK